MQENEVKRGGRHYKSDPFIPSIAEQNFNDLFDRKNKKNSFEDLNDRGPLREARIPNHFSHNFLSSGRILIIGFPNAS